MNRYLCKCGRAVNKSTNADNTGNRETEGCEGCPYLMPWGPTEWDHTRHAMVTDVKGYECRMSPTLEYRTELHGHLDDKTTIRITSLDFDFLERVSDWVKEHYPNGELSGGFSRDRIRPAEYVDEGRYRYTLACSQNKKGIAAPEPAETSTTPTDANTLPAPGCPADAGSATQSLSAAGPASLEAEPEATPFDYSGLDAQTVADLHLAEREYLGGRKLAEMGLRRMADGVAIAHDALCGGCDNLSQAHNNQYSKDTFGAWCESIGIHRKAAERLLQVSKLMDNSTPREQKVLEELTPSVLYEASRPSAEPEAVEALKSKQVKTLKEFRALEAQLKAEREAREKAEHETELERKEREDAHAAALRYKAEADRRAQDQNRLEGLVQTVTHERDGARQALAAAKLRGDKLKEENDALREQPIRGDFADADEIDRRAQEKAEAMTAEYRDQIAELQDRAETGDANACYDQVILASRALENAWTLAKSAYKRLPAGMRAYPREMLHNAFAKFEEELKCL